MTRCATKGEDDCDVERRSRASVLIDGHLVGVIGTSGISRRVRKGGCAVQVAIPFRGSSPCRTTPALTAPSVGSKWCDGHHEPRNKGRMRARARDRPLDLADLSCDRLFTLELGLVERVSGVAACLEVGAARMSREKRKTRRAGGRKRSVCCASRIRPGDGKDARTRMHRRRIACG